jgi:iron complex transport system permease protein
MIVHRSWHWIVGGIVLILVAIGAVAYGTVPVSLSQLIDVLMGRGGPTETAIIMTLRLPRVALALLVGVALGMSGTVLQGALRNPLAEPYLLGVSGGAAVGAVVGITLGVVSAMIPLTAFAGATVAAILALSIARGAVGSSRVDPRTLLMAGVVVGAFANAVIMILLANVPPNTIRGALWWMMGSVGDANWTSVLSLAVYVAVGAAILLFFARDIDVLTLGEDAAAALGVDVERASRRAFLVSALIAAATVAAAGLIGFVGLMVPHLVRAAGIRQHRPMLIAAAIVGGTLVIAADLIARVVLPPAELPLGAVTALLGVPFFLIQLRRAK